MLWRRPSRVCRAGAACIAARAVRAAAIGAIGLSGLVQATEPTFMKTIGMITGISYVSGIDYYRGINERVARLLPGKIMPHNSEMVIVSVDCDEYVRLLKEEDTEGVQEYLLRAAWKLDRVMVDFIIIASNTAHICYSPMRARFPDRPVLHIADCVAKALPPGKRVGLLGTEPTMRDGSWLKERLALHGVQVLVPQKDEDRQRCYQIICDELSFEIFKEESRSFFADLARQLYSEGADGGVILGCTEIELLLRQSDVPEVPLYRSAELHMEAAALVQAGQANLEDYLPGESTA